MIPVWNGAASRRVTPIFLRALGFAWDHIGDGKTSLRGAFGVFYGSISGNEWNTMTNFQPFSTRLTFPTLIKGQTRPEYRWELR